MQRLHEAMQAGEPLTDAERQAANTLSKLIQQQPQAQQEQEPLTDRDVAILNMQLRTEWAKQKISRGGHHAETCREFVLRNVLEMQHDESVVRRITEMLDKDFPQQQETTT